MKYRRRTVILVILFFVAHFMATYFAFRQLFILSWYDPQDVILAQKIWQILASALSLPLLLIIIRINPYVALESMSLWGINSLLAVSTVCFLFKWMRRLHQRLSSKSEQAQ